MKTTTWEDPRTHRAAVPGQGANAEHVPLQVIFIKEKYSIVQFYFICIYYLTSAFYTRCLDVKLLAWIT